MSFSISVVADKDTINLGETVTVTYSCTGAYDTTIQGDNMPSALDLGSGDVSGTMKFLPVVSGEFNITLTALGVVHQNKGLEVDQVEANVAKALVIVN
jgi:hypothetical protein